MSINPFGAGLFADFHNANDPQQAVQLVKERLKNDFVDHSPAFGASPDKDGFASTMGFINSAFRQHYQVERIVEDGNAVVGIWRAQVTHIGQFLHVAPTGKSFSVSGITAYTLCDRKITAHWEHFDVLTILITLGVVPPLGS